MEAVRVGGGGWRHMCTDGKDIDEKKKDSNSNLRAKYQKD